MQNTRTKTLLSNQPDNEKEQLQFEFQLLDASLFRTVYGKHARILTERECESKVSKGCMKLDPISNKFQGPGCSAKLPAFR